MLMTVVKVTVTIDAEHYVGLQVRKGGLGKDRGRGAQSHFSRAERVRQVSSDTCSRTNHLPF